MASALALADGQHSGTRHCHSIPQRGCRQPPGSVISGTHLSLHMQRKEAACARVSALNTN